MSISSLSGFWRPFTRGELLEVEVRESLLLGHSGVSFLWSRTEVHLCGFLKLIRSVRDGDFEVKFALRFRMGFKGSNNLVFSGGTKQTDSVDAKPNTWTQCTLPGPAYRLNDSLLWTESINMTCVLQVN